MYDRELFDDELRKTGYKKRFLSDSIGISHQRFTKITNGELEWKLSEIDSVCCFLKWNRAKRDLIFFAKTVTGEETNVPV